MRITNNTGETISIEPGETINVSFKRNIVRTMSKRIDLILIQKVKR